MHTAPVPTPQPTPTTPIQNGNEGEEQNENQDSDQQNGGGKKRGGLKGLLDKLTKGINDAFDGTGDDEVL